MFARASVRSSLAARSLSRPAVVLPSQVDIRGLKTSPTLRNTAPTTEAQDPFATIQKYGPISFWGALAAVAVTKEVFIIDAEFLLSLEIGAFALTGYVIAGDSFNKYAEEDDAQKTKQFNEANDFALDMLNQYKMIQEVNQAKPEVLQQYLGEFESSLIAHAKYQTVLPKHAARKSVLAALEQIQAKEEHAETMAWQEDCTKAVAAVSDAVMTGDKQLKTQMLDLAISNMGEDIQDTTPEQDPIKRLFMKAFD